MVDIVYDKRVWRIRLDMDNSECPHLYYPANIHACKESKNGEGECKLELCPFYVCRVVKEK